MKRIATLVIIIFCTSLFNLLYSQDFWEQLYFPDTTDISCITTNYQGDIFIGTLGDNSGVYRSLDNGQTWDFILNNNQSTVHKIEINDQGDLYVGKGGPDKFVRSVDNGDSWETISLPPYCLGSFTSILCNGNDTVYLSTWEDGGGLLIRTPDYGISWDSLFYSASHSGDHITDIVTTTNNEIYVSIMGYFFNTGGVFKSEDNGISWDYIGLYNHQVNAMAINQNDEVFTGDWYIMGAESSGVYALYENSDDFELVRGTMDVTDIGINSEGQIFVTNIGGVLRSFDNGDTFEYVNEGISGTFRKLHIDNLGYVYITKTHSLYRSINPTVSINEQKINLEKEIIIYPNPATNNFKIQSEMFETSEAIVEIFDLYGKKVKTINISKGQTEIEVNTEAWQRGLYVVRVMSKDGFLRSGKVVVH